MCVVKQIPHTPNHNTTQPTEAHISSRSRSARLPSLLLYLLWVHLLSEFLVAVDGFLRPLYGAILPKLLPCRFGVAQVSPLDEILRPFTTHPVQEMKKVPRFEVTILVGE